MSDKIAAAARRWDEARREALALKKKRAAFLCERSERYEANDPEAPDTYERPETTCWKKIVGPFADGSEEGQEARRLTPEEQCAPCRERYAVHLAMRAAVRRRGANLRAMMALLAAERKRLAKQSQEAPEGGPGKEATREA